MQQDGWGRGGGTPKHIRPFQKQYAEWRAALVPPTPHSPRGVLTLQQILNHQQIFGNHEQQFSLKQFSNLSMSLRVLLRGVGETFVWRGELPFEPIQPTTTLITTV